MPGSWVDPRRMVVIDGRAFIMAREARPADLPADRVRPSRWRWTVDVLLTVAVLGPPGTGSRMAAGGGVKSGNIVRQDLSTAAPVFAWASTRFLIGGDLLFDRGDQVLALTQLAFALFNLAQKISFCKCFFRIDVEHFLQVDIADSRRRQRFQRNLDGREPRDRGSDQSGKCKRREFVFFIKTDSPH